MLPARKNNHGSDGKQVNKIAARLMKGNILQQLLGCVTAAICTKMSRTRKGTSLMLSIIVMNYVFVAHNHH